MVSSPCDDCALDCAWLNQETNACDRRATERHYEYQFDEIVDRGFDELQAMKVCEETGEFAFEAAKLASKTGEFTRKVRLGLIFKAIIEAFDIIHSVETFLRNQDPQLVQMAYEYVIKKNDDRGYYGVRDGKQ